MKYLLITILAFYLSACSIFQTSENEEQEVTKQKEQTEEVYVFDDVADDGNSDDIKELEEEIDSSINENESVNQDFSTENVNESPVKENALSSGDLKKEIPSYYLQLGAFSSLKRAEQYVDQITSDVPFNLSIIYNSQTSLYTVRSSSYTTRTEVEKIRTEFWKRDLFKDSFIVTE